MSNLSVLLTRVTIRFATFMLIASLERFTGPTASLTLTNGFLIQGPLLAIREKRLAPKMSITFGARDSECGESARRPSHTITAGLVTAVGGIPCARFVTRFTH